jgi:hypothetical protein
MTTTPDSTVTSADAKPRKRRRSNGEGRKNEPDMYAGMVRRMMKALGKKISAGDIAALPDLVRLHADLDEVILTTVGALVSDPEFAYSWGDVSKYLTEGGMKITRQGVQQKYGTRLAERGITPARKTGAHPRFK